MRYVFVDYNAYLSALLKLEENIGKSIDEIEEKYNIKTRMYSLTKNSAYLRQKANIPLGAYFIASLTQKELDFLNNSDQNLAFIVTIKASLEELENLAISDVFIYEMHEMENGYYLRTTYDKYVLPCLSDLEIESLDPKVKEAYLKNMSDIRYYFKYLTNGSIVLEVLHSDNFEGDTYYMIDYPYAEQLERLVIFLKSTKSGTFQIEEKKSKEKKHSGILKYLIEHKGE